MILTQNVKCYNDKANLMSYGDIGISIIM